MAEDGDKATPAPASAAAKGRGGGGGGEAGEEQESVKLFVGQVPKHMTEAELLAMFQEVAAVDEVTVIKDKATKASRDLEGFPFLHSSHKNFKIPIFSASRIDIPSAWQMTQCGIDEGEEPRAAAVRELREETGVTSAEIVAEAPNWLTYDFPPNVRDKLNARWGTNWKGQAQKWTSTLLISTALPVVAWITLKIWSIKKFLPYVENSSTWTDLPSKFPTKYV